MTAFGPSEPSPSLQIEGHYRQLFEQNGAVQLLVDPPTGTIVEANQAAEAFYGYPPGALQGMRLSDLALLPEREVLQATELAVSVGGHYYGFPHRLASGETRLVEIYAGPLEVDGRRLLHQIVHDVTERVHAVAALRQSEAQVRLFVEHAPAAVAMLDRDMRYILVSQRWLTDHGLAGRNLIGVRHDDIFPSDSWREVHRRCLGGAVERSAEDQLTRADGSTEWVQWEVRPWRDDTGEIGGVLVFTEIITGRKRAEENERQLVAERAARLADQRAAMEWQDTFDAIDLVIVLIDADGVITRANTFAHRQAGSAPGELVGRRLDQVATTPLWERAAALTAAVREGGVPATARATDAGTERTWELAVTPYAAGDADKVILVARDLTEVIRLQASLERSERMSAMGSLVAGVAHEVRNPLFGISSTLDAFRARFADRQDFQRYHAVLSEQVDRLSTLMRDLLEYGKPASGDYAVLPLEPVFDQAARQCADLAGEHGVAVEVAVSGALPLVRMQASRMTQVFHNLIENAIQHAPPATAVRVRARAAEDRGSRWIECTVADAGPGFPPHAIARVFEPFFTQRRGGTGLGLAIAQRIVEEHEGTVTAANVAPGAVVRVLLPAASPPEGSGTRGTE